MKSVFFIFTLSHAAGILQKNDELYVADMEDENASKNLYNGKELFRSFCERVSDIERHIDNFNDDICRNLKDIKYLGTRFQSAADDFICYHEYGHQCVYEYLDEDFQKLIEFCLFFKTSVSDKITILNEEACKYDIQLENGLIHTQILLQKIIIFINKLNEANNRMTKLFKKIKNKIIKWERKVEHLKTQFQCDIEENLFNKYHQGDRNIANNKRINIKDIIFGNSEGNESDTENEISGYNEENKYEDLKDFEDKNLDNKHNLAIKNALYEYYDDNEEIVEHLENINAEHKKISSLLKQINILFSASYTIIDLEERFLDDIKDSIKKSSINLINEKISLIKTLQGKFLSKVNYLKDETKSESLRIFIENNLESVNSYKKSYIKYFHDHSSIFPIKMFNFSIDKELNDIFLTLYLTFAELQIAIKIYTIEIKRHNIEIDSNFKKNGKFFEFYQIADNDIKNHFTFINDEHSAIFIKKIFDMKISLNRIINQSNLDYVITDLVDLKTNINIHFEEILNKLLESDKVYLRSVDYEFRDLKKYCNEVYEKINKEINCKSEMGIFFEYRLVPQRKFEFNDSFNKVLILDKIDETSNDKKDIYISDLCLEISIKNSFERLFSGSKEKSKNNLKYPEEFNINIFSSFINQTVDQLIANLY